MRSSDWSQTLLRCMYSSAATSPIKWGPEFAELQRMNFGSDSNVINTTPLNVKFVYGHKALVTHKYKLE